MCMHVFQSGYMFVCACVHVCISTYITYVSAYIYECIHYNTCVSAYYGPGTVQVSEDMVVNTRKMILVLSKFFS